MLDMTFILILFALPLALIIFPTIYQAYFTSLRNVPGPRLAKFTRIWLAKAFASRQYHKISTELHRKYGPIVRIAPNEYSIDHVDAAQVIYRSRDPLAKVCYATLLDASHTSCCTASYHANARVRDM